MHIQSLTREVVATIQTMKSTEKMEKLFKNNQANIEIRNMEKICKQDQANIEIINAAKILIQLKYHLKN